MKSKIFILFILAQGLSINLNAQDDKYNKAMLKWVCYFNDSLLVRQNSEMLMNTFARIGKIEKDKWLPYYYAAHCATNAASLEKDNNLADELTAKAEGYLDIIDKLSPNNSEALVLRAYVAFTQINVDFMGRGIKNSIYAEKVLNQALKIDKNNPRAYFLLGMGLYVKAENYGGNKELACQYFNKAAELDIKDSDALAPVWQRSSVGKVLKVCAKNNLNLKKQ
jgi:tetratricopeptide (TPR) repeat protein